MFLGQYQHSIDSKGRLTIPVRFREVLTAEGAYVTRGFDHNLMVLTIPSFDKVSKRVNSMSMTDPRTRLLRRQIFANAELVEVDRAGRILIPQFLREAVGLDGEAMVVGSGDFFEIWSPGNWSGQIDKLQEAESDTQRFLDLDLSPALE